MSVGFDTSIETEGTVKATNLYADESYLKKVFVRDAAVNDKDAVNLESLTAYVAANVSAPAAPAAPDSTFVFAAYLSGASPGDYLGSIPVTTWTQTSYTVPVDAVCSAVYVRVRVAPGAGNTARFELWKNEVDTGTFVEITDTDLRANFAPGVSFAAGDDFAFFYTNDGASPQQINITTAFRNS